MTFAIKTFSICLAALWAAALAAPADAAYVIDIRQVGTDVVSTGSGSVDLRAFTYVGTLATDAGLVPSTPTAILGAAGDYAAWVGTMTGPGGFGPGGATIATTTTGTIFGFDLVGSAVIMAVPLGYLSGSELSQSTATFADASFASLGLTEGIYVYNWGAGANADSLTVRISSQAPAVPEPGTWAMMLLGIGAICAAIRRRLYADPQSCNSIPQNARFQW